MFRLSKVAVVLATTSMMLSAPVLAAESNAPSFDNVGLSYVKFDVADESLDGFKVNLETSFSPKVFLSVNHLDATDSFVENTGSADAAFEISTELSHANLGYKFYDTGSTVGYMAAGFSRFSVSSEVSLSDNSFADSYSQSESGWNAQVGVRSALTERFEVDAALRHIDIGADGDQEFSVSARYYFEPRFSLSAGYTRIDGDTSYTTIGASYHF
ncbi:hypothetical protein PSI9734_01655 [Pseudidiomarina piscicola]|uniref:Outer membrane protein beta-barrel domain-containing protein n=1 Tax=Pseudidiomarina piscicola TaxID=2614830 RepID=A0A6S6WMH8_9GAMM|nr:outer membrane beta-barrel protein [Pseudidiomarina piscicola]CAB0151242.1 hypothetical protein PSI9734_01655 [Pseudidiomarina piscicola]VZT40748.1 hypothetical protein PSI9734_01655 [Pseudomonas aeruginosa]